jgi:hypothetical protein
MTGLRRPVRRRAAGRGRQHQRRDESNAHFWMTDRAPTEQEMQRMLHAARAATRGDRAVAFMRPKTSRIYLSGVLCPELEQAAHRDDIGVMVQPGTNYFLPRVVHRWAVDNGCFGAHRRGEDFDENAWWGWVERIDRPNCLFVVAPDVPGDAAATLERSRPWLRAIRGEGHAAALAAQNGVEDMAIPWDEFDVLFLAGLPT